jgi:hypothetical protein
MKENNELNTGKKEIRFWRNPLTWRTTNTGMNENVISTYVRKQNMKDVIASIKDGIVTYNDGRKFLETKYKTDYFISVVNDCLRDIYAGRSGYVFTESQLKEVLKIKPNIQTTFSKEHGCYRCRKY